MDRRLIGVGIFAAVLAVVVIVVVVARGGDGDGDTETAEAKPKPTVEIPEGPPPTELVIEDIEEGDGAEAKSGDQVSVNYVGVLFDGGKEFDASFGGQPFEFQLGAGSVIPGWDQGVEGMKVGGRRQLVIPPDLGYGAQGSPPDIPPNATLVFVIDLLSVN
ncbi:MAG TPA: FKBP-type peptidyl-prolyl cis-trans isomerase [Solirubrobacterales bacterium]|nr:FKBP-type peptidyl-prolyl cis-trans isomerase [Solirubrobacterales bacterium]